jgi:hypothetical protein
VRRWLLILVLTGGSVRGQTLQVSAGASTLFPSEGGELTLYTAEANTTVGAGVENGHLVAGAQTNFLFHGWDFTAGDSKIFLATQQLGLSTVNRGVSSSRKNVDSTLTMFAGAVGQAYSTPFFSGLSAHRVGAGFAYTKRWEPGKRTSCRGAGCLSNHGILELSTVEAYTNGKLTALEGGSYQWRGLSLLGTAGLLEGKTYATADASYRFSHAAFDVGRQVFIWRTERSTVQSGNVSTWIGPVTTHAGWFSSHTATGKTAGAGLRFGPVTTSGDIFLSSGQRILSGSVMEKLSRHFSLSQFYTRSGNQQSFNFGGSFTSNPVTLTVGWQQVFVPFATAAPFQKVLSVTLAFQLPHSTTLNLATVAAPTGGTRWSAYGGTYAETPWLPGTSSGQSVGRAQIGRYGVTGHVVGADGVGVEGIAVQVGDQLVYSNATGEFAARFRKARQVAVGVLLTESTSPGSWTVVSCPGTATPSGVPIQIQVRREP